jgi:hypothetical protein
MVHGERRPLWWRLWFLVLLLPLLSALVGGILFAQLHH